jgi:hypothetical protein
VAIAIFFMSIVVIGHYMLLNLFLAILLKFISQKQDEGDDDQVDSTALPMTDRQSVIGPNGDNQNEEEEKEETLSLKSSNSNIEEEFEQIKLQLQELSKMSLN